ncbi:RNA demethylase ALKBH10B-like [Phoenix dactylifera]|uniref:RNA demethylase ALKBH10B-like n=1 Tax=Phoenix dactylifera TaxID=42345 RepID=A0A8B9AXT8_PHODC|nr:RNA demethylase ALKBH10B-like [Phoenix dactylifera]
MMTTMVAGVAAGAGAEAFARDAIIAWFRGEFAAANAIIDALCGHLAQIEGGSEYEEVFAAIHRRRMNWIPVLHMQKYFSIADVGGALRRVASRRQRAAAAEEEAEIKKGKEEEMEVAATEEEKYSEDSPKEEEEEEMDKERSIDGGGVVGAFVEEVKDGDSNGDSSDQKVSEEGDVDGGSQGEHTSVENVQICSDHEHCVARPDSIKILKGFVAKEAVKGHMVNVVKGLKLYEDIFTNSELLRLAEFINELRLSGRRGELSGETFIFFNKQIKGNKREILQLGVPLFQPTNEEASSNIEPIPPILQTAIDHLVQWHVIPENKRPNSCIINFFDEDEYSQPYFKPPHLDNPISTLFLSETTTAFGRVLVSDNNGNYKGSLTLPLKEGSLLVMRGNSADMARHVICQSPNRRVSITFVKVRPANNQTDSSTMSPLTTAITLWQPGSPPPQQMQGGGLIAYGPHGVIPAAWGATLPAPVVVLPSPRPMAMAPGRRMSRSGTGVFLPWAVGPKKYTKHLPPRIQKRRFLSLPSLLEAQV